MNCPFCGHIEDKVIDSRLGRDGDVIRRRRECLKCEGRFTSYERIEEILPAVIKKDGRREPFDRQKILHGIEKACEKRPIGVDTIEAFVKKIEKKLQGTGEKEIPSSWIGEEIMSGLKSLDEVAYVRFASVYRQFKDIKEFMEEIKGFLTK
ncbi:MAG TPA: transcriptional repressor NrdR [Nitrospirae bacterium]|nr:transcriptional repressor NrdR [bacterium BMS3Abin10]GBE39042.1 transcriptional repressor NrdR [bacterium BMS3Bbin08]HDH50970.1 transcriptional repressor NrdR [Nitrospirota bacterium]HDK41045.1 transcriptional repressor NrdR [Nitrospirota bacterium]HDK81466.1 transcriptional repressor NrdR [Nitrospirota bacterium]